MKGSRGTAAAVAIAAIITYHVLLFALIFIRPDLDPYWHTISEWAIGPWGWVMTAAFISGGVSYAVLFFVLRSEVRGWWGYLGLVLFGICSLALIGVGIFTMDPMTTPPDQLTPRGIAHILTGMTQMTLLPFAALLIGLNLAFKNYDWVDSRRTLVITSFLPLAGFVGFITHLSLYVIPLGEGAYGPEVPIGWPARFLFLTYAVWVITVGWQAIKVGAIEEQRAYFEGGAAAWSADKAL